mgnify:CR=1 FL=1
MVLGAALCTSASVRSGDDQFELARSVLTALIPAVALHLALAVPDGTLRSRGTRLTVGLGYLAALGLGVVVGPEPAGLPMLPYLLAALVAGAIGLDAGFVQDGLA